MFAKVFGQIFDSSIAEDYNCRRMFMDLLVLADSDGVVDMTAEAISRRTNVPLGQVTKYIGELQQPDNSSRSKMEEGRRLIPLDSTRGWGWQIVNYRHYRTIRDEEARRSYFRDQKRKQRGKKPVQDKKVDRGGHCQTVPSASSSASASSFPEGFETEWKHFIEHRENKKAPMTQHAQDLFRTTLAERPLEAVEAVKTAIMRNWTGFKWTWFDNDKRQQSNGVKPWVSAAEAKQAEIDEANRIYRAKKAAKEQAIRESQA